MEPQVTKKKVKIQYDRVFFLLSFWAKNILIIFGLQIGFSGAMSSKFLTFWHKGLVGKNVFGLLKARRPYSCGDTNTVQEQFPEKKHKNKK